LPVEGVKFFIAVSASIGSSSSISFDDVLFSHVKTILDGAANVICERSIYAGDGFARLLLMGRFLGSDYFAFMEQVIFKLNDTYMRELFSARTVTAFGSRRDPIFGQEQLTVSLPRAGTLRSVARRSAEQLLEEGEGAHVEVKASAFLNFDRLVDESVPDWSKLRPEFVKAVCGLLNQRNAVAGTLIVGAVETHRYRDWLGGRDAKLPEYGEFTVLGIEEDNPSGNWDKYRRRLEDALDAGITPAPTDFLSISFEEVERDGTRKLMLRLDLQPAHKPFYASNHDGLWVRRGARVIDLHGPERDEFVHELQQR